MPGNWRSGTKLPARWPAASSFRLTTVAISNLMDALAGLGALEAARAAPTAPGFARLGSGVPVAGSSSSPFSDASVRALPLAVMALLAKIFITNPGLLVSGVTFAVGGMVGYSAAVKLQFCVTESAPSV